MLTLVIAEKPSVARDVARVIGATQRRQGYLEGGGYLVTWAVGHLVGLAQPHEIDPGWKVWSRRALPMLPRDFPLVVLEDGRDQYEVVERLLNDRRVSKLVCATDAGREGELIFRYIVERAGAKLPFERLWISSLTDEAIRAGFAALAPGSRYDPLADAARARSRADWLVGMNLSRLYSIGRKDLFTVGRVQTPTLAMVVERDRAIRQFVAEPYLEVEATLSAGKGSFVATFHELKGTLRGADGRLRLPKSDAARLPADGVRAAELVAHARGSVATLVAVDRSRKKTPPPLLYDLTDLQRDANKLFGLTAKSTLDAAQALYERHKMLSYPRTDSRHLSADVARTLEPVREALAARYAAELAGVVPGATLSKRFVDDAKVSDHHAIVPTGVFGRLPESSPEAKVFDLVCRRLLMAYMPEKVEAVTSVVARIEGEGYADHYVAKGVALEVPGFSSLEKKTRKDKSGDDAVLPVGLEEGGHVAVTNVEAVSKKTQPPKPFTEATLLTAMETAGRTLDAKELARAMRESGLGTPATRAAILETLIARGYVVRDGKALRATEKGELLVDSVHAHVKSPAMTGEWELRLSKMERGEEPFESFMLDIERFVAGVVGDAPQGEPERALAAPHGLKPRSSGGAPPERATPATPIPTPSSGGSRTPSIPPAGSQASSRRVYANAELDGLLHERFGFASFRPHQREICEAVTAGGSALVVMPTGAGKSLCYQLPGYARGGTTVVVSPLIALIEDQVAKLRAFGFAAERIHSGMDRAASRAVCARYLSGELDFFFLAPERLSVPGFPEMLGKRPPTLVAVDEAHCISQWGHDFRPDYRLLRDRLRALGPVPILALTATATPRVQADIVQQLGIASASTFIFGFRRTNLAIEVVDVGRADRSAIALSLLAEAGRRPAIVYAPTRKEAENSAAVLAKTLRAATYHAGMSAEARADVQGRFLEGRLDVIVATIAFGMGIDKADVRTVIHLALPASLEGYYQEIGRAGRDGAPSRAVLLFGARDRHTHEFFLDRDYPDPSVLDGLYAVVAKGPLPEEVLASRMPGDRERFEKALEKLYIHGGVEVDPDGVVTVGRPDYRGRYELQRAHKLEQIDRMMTFAGTAQCRMRGLVRHFGDAEDADAVCGLCDICRPGEVLVSGRRSASEAELAVLEDVVATLEERDGQSLGKLFEAVAEDRCDRGTFEALLSAASRLGVVAIRDESFVRESRTIPYRVVALGPRAHVPLDRLESALELVSLEDFAAPGAKRGRKGRAPARRTTRAPTKRGATHGRSATEAFAGLDARLVDALRAFRKEEAARRHIPPFLVFTDRDLHAIAEATPRTEAELAQTGLGAKKLKAISGRVLRVIREATRS